MTTVHKHVLDNGLTVLLKPLHHAPLISWRVMYRVGSRNEQTGGTGLSHWLEHMMFKGTPTFPGGQLDRMIDREGGYWNAHTFIDFTGYYETMPADRIDLALRLEADRMVNAQFDADEVESERTVIISERQGAENSPTFWLGEEVTAAAFRVHPYRHEVLGDMADLHTITRDDLYGYYKRHYMPNNAVAVAVGDFDPDVMLARVRALYEVIPPGTDPRPVARQEPAQVGERRVRIERPGDTAYVTVAYKAPRAIDPDWFPLAVLESVLGGPSVMGGGSIDGKTSRLYRALVLSELAAGVDASLIPTIDPYLFEFSLTLREGRTHAEVEAALDAELERVRREAISQAELEKAIKQARALFAYSTESVSGQAFWLAFSEIFADYGWFEGFVERLSAVTVADVRAAAEKYLDPRQRTVGWYIPTGDGDLIEHGEASA
ncbi:MAG: insulinase family protein [Anaerolineae bacterium]|nr:insulinase family protein [Anaerolineae bacterium]